MNHPQDNSWIAQSIAPSNAQSNDASNPSAAKTNGADDAALAESWAAFSDLLEKSQPSLDESRLVSAVLSRTAHRQRSRRQWTVGAIGLATAASLLVAVSLVRISRDGGNVAMAPQNGELKDGVLKDGGVTNEIAESAPRPVVLPAWDDEELIDSLAAAHREATQLEGNWRQKSDPMVDFQNRLDALQQEMESSSL